MNARGAMEIVVATIGLSLGILTPQMFSIIVMVAIVTSFLAPVGLRLTMPRVRMTEDEARRILASESTGAFDPTRVRVLLATGGGENALAAAPLAFGLARKSSAPVKIVHVDGAALLVAAAGSAAGVRGQRHRAGRAAARRCAPGGRAPEIAQVGGAQHRARHLRRGEARLRRHHAGLGRRAVDRRGGRRAGGGRGAVPRRDHEGAGRAAPTTSGILVPVDGSVASRLAVELALRYAEATGAELALAVLTERRPQAAAYADLSGTHVPAEIRATSDEELQRISIAFRASDIKPNILHLAFDPRSSAIAQEVETRALRPGRRRRREPRHPAPAVLRLRERAPDPRHAHPGRGRRPQPVAARPERRMTDAAPPPRLILIGGGARSGKSRFALARAHALGRRRLFIATAEPSDDEMRDRIARHRAERGAAFDTLEEPRALPEALAAARDHDVILVDCLTIWISNLLVDGRPPTRSRGGSPR